MLNRAIQKNGINAQNEEYHFGTPKLVTILSEFGYMLEHLSIPHYLSSSKLFIFHKINIVDGK